MTAVAPVLLAARGVRARLGRAEVLRGVEVELHAGEVHAVLGPNGSGKTTLLRCMAGLLRAHCGTIEVEGLSVWSLSARARARRIALMPQRPEPPPGLSVRELVEFGRFCHAGSRVLGAHARAVSAALAGCEIEHLAERSTAEVSGGELQRAFLAMALAQEPAVLLLDEPVSALDVGHQLDALGLVRTLTRQRGLAAAVVLHDLHLALRFADRATLLLEGRVEASGPPARALAGEHLERVFQVRDCAGERGLWLERAGPSAAPQGLTTR